MQKYEEQTSTPASDKQKKTPVSIITTLTSQMHQHKLCTQLQIRFARNVCVCVFKNRVYGNKWSCSHLTSAWSTLGPAYNKFGYNEDIFCIKIIDSNVKKFGYNKHLIFTSSFFCIVLLVASGTTVDRNFTCSWNADAIASVRCDRTFNVT